MTIEELIKQNNRRWEDLSFRERLLIFMNHREDCGTNNEYFLYERRKCDCGFDLVVKELDDMLEKQR